MDLPANEGRGFFVFESVKTSRVSDEIVAQVYQMIMDGRLGPGDRLVPEVEMAEQMGVSRASVREALSILESQGIVERKKSGGTYIRRYSLQATIDALSAGPKSDKEMFSDFMEARELLELSVLKLAVARGDQRTYRLVESAIKLMEEVIAKGGSAVEADILFHQAIAACAQNAVLVNLVKTLNSMLQDMREKTLAYPGRLPECLEEHRRLYQAVRSQDLKKAREEMTIHFQKVKDILDTISI